MNVRLTGLGLLIAVLIGSFSMPSLIAQDKAPKAQKADKAQGDEKKANVQGTVQNISKDTSTITVRTTGTVTRLVVYNANTQFLYGHSDAAKPGSLAQVKTSNYISCAGTFDAKAQLMATQCVYRESK
jgi:hypothetical protein